MRATAIKQHHTHQPHSYFDNFVHSNQSSVRRQSPQTKYVPIQQYPKQQIRSSSLPVDKKIQASQTTIADNSMTAINSRKFRIFNSATTAINNHSYSNQNKKLSVPSYQQAKTLVSPILLANNTFSTKKSTPIQIINPQMILIPKSGLIKNQFQMTSPLQLYPVPVQNPLQNSKIIINRSTETYKSKPLPQNILKKLNQKQHQITYLKMEIQRHHRCQKLQKQNQILNNKIMQHLQNTSTELAQQNNTLLSICIPKKQTIDIKSIAHQEQQTKTPIQSLEDLKIINLPQPPKDHKHIVKQSTPRKIIQKIAQPIILNYLQTVSQEPPSIIINPQKASSIPVSINIIKPYETMTFQDKSQSIRHNCHCSANKKQNISTYIHNLQQTYHQTNRMARTFVADIPISRRLSQINKILQVNYETYKHRTLQKNRINSPQRGKSNSHYKKSTKLYF